MIQIFKTDNSELYLGDCTFILDRLPENSVDLIFADPPYHLSNDGFTCKSGKRTSVNKAKWDKSKGFDEDYVFHYNWIDSCKRVLKQNGTMWISGTYHSIYYCGYALKSQNWHIINDIAWFKPNAPPNLSCRMFTASHENLLWVKKSKKAKHTFDYEFMKNEYHYEDPLKKPKKQMRSVWSIPVTPKREKTFGKHPTQKPEALLERIILASSNKGDIILDPFAGSCTTGVIAKRFDRNFIGIDNDENYLKDIGIRRLLQC